MKKIIIYLMMFTSYIFFSILIFLFSPLIVNKTNLGILLLIAIVLWTITVLVFEKKNVFFKENSKIAMLYNYFDFESIKAIVKEKANFKFWKKDSDEYEDCTRKITVLTIKILNNDQIMKYPHSKRLRTIGEFLRIIEDSIFEIYGTIYNIKDDTITCVFNTIADIEDISFEVIKAALRINIAIQQKAQEMREFNTLRINMGINEQDMDFYVRDNRILLGGGFEVSEELSKIDGMGNLLILGDVYLRYMNKMENEYIGKYYINDKEYKVYKVISIPYVQDEIEEEYNKSKIMIKPGKLKKLLKYFDKKLKEKISK